ncbi:dihydrolipoyl dehydrogenase family protein [Prosthecobacter vanneervenii]|uniref:Pyruvate/2-oxoglutarate dehydrogenase complex dihydrolipoamide dehydrogenase (E3) component n=1 Tax=Prosthecobacter vanneervenii TaxID=48466 RepID=A0A7W7Y9D4_9BACT|nr:dihydrolipoyl dehydrogenase [Prosthecobacter vanneervenii]MBB5031929.1 pyruvate/2-oxoglutarate dehydrogenase complex dihydrolipoamide dehydrogenase (E3) component [Prosthecobacter vanneervenii]
MSENSFDFIVIGGGSGGYAAARTAHSAGLRVAVVDGASELGGLCILRGCMPSKTLIESANRQLHIRHAAEFGLKATSHGVDVRTIRDRKRTLIADFAGYRQGQLEDGRFALHRGHARFIDAHTLEVTPRDGSSTYQLSAKSFCIATGSEVFVPDVPGLAETGFWTSDDVLDTESLPKSIAVLGGGAIALEMAHYLEAMGCAVTLIQRNAQLLTGLDRECSDVIAKAYSERGMKVHLGTHLNSIVAIKDKKLIEFTQGGHTHAILVDEILLAMGRQPATKSLALEAAKVSLHKTKVVVNDCMQTSQPHIFAAGDVCSPLDVVHIAIQQGEIAARNAARLIRGETADETIDYRLTLFGVFSHPQVAVVGATTEKLRAQGIPFLEASYPFNDHGKSMVMGEMAGFVKMLAHKETGEILGACVVGPEATELIHEVVIAMNFRSTVQQFMAIPHYHPTLSEIWTYPAEEIADQMAE